APAESYLHAGRILAAAVATGADALHPGYGFLSERADFARAVTAAGLAFVGPRAEAIEAMGDKIASKRVAASAGVSVIPGHDGPVADAAEAREIAASVGYPVMVKASAGGGGKGMRVVERPEDLAEAYETARSEARTAFGDDRVLIERFVARP